MPNLNKVMLMGNLTRDPELRYTPNNTAVVGLGVAVNRRWRNQQGEQQDETTFVDCDAFGRTAEVINQYLKKGRPLFIEGRLKLDQWEDRDGNKRSKLKVVVDRFEFVDSRSDESSGGGNYSRTPSTRQPVAAPVSSGSTDDSNAHVPITDDDIPF